MTDISIIIVCYKGWDRLNKCLYELNSFSGKRFNTEVIIVDNKSDDEIIFKTEKQYSNFRFIYNKVNGGYANGCNLGSLIAEGEFLLILNPDTVAYESEIEKLLNVAKQNSDYSILSCNQVNENGRESIVAGPFPSVFNITGFQRTIFGGKKPGNKSRKPEVSFPDWISGSVMLIRRETFRKIGGMDEDFWMYFEDVDLCRRVRDINGKIALCRDITIEHNHGGSSRINLRTTSITKTEVYISRHVYISKHKTGFERILIQTFIVINNLISAGIMALLGLILFFIPKMFVRTLIYMGLIRYYTGSVIRLSWISPRSVNFRKRL